MEHLIKRGQNVLKWNEPKYLKSTGKDFKR